MRRCAVVRRPAPSTTTTTTSMTKSGMRTFVSPPHQRRRGPPPGFPRRRWKRLSRRWCDRCVVASSWSCCFDITRCYTSLRGDRCRPSCRIPHDKKHNEGGNLQQNPGGYIETFSVSRKATTKLLDQNDRSNHSGAHLFSRRDPETTLNRFKTKLTIDSSMSRKKESILSFHPPPRPLFHIIFYTPQRKYHTSFLRALRQKHSQDGDKLTSPAGRPSQNLVNLNTQSSCVDTPQSSSSL
jgi:hypothetical protein